MDVCAVGVCGSIYTWAPYVLIIATRRAGRWVACVHGWMHVRLRAWLTRKRKDESWSPGALGNPGRGSWEATDANSISTPLLRKRPVCHAHARPPVCRCGRVNEVCVEMPRRGRPFALTFPATARCLFVDSMHRYHGTTHIG
jgi:hypothetical protein